MTSNGCLPECCRAASRKSLKREQHTEEDEDDDEEGEEEEHGENGDTSPAEDRMMYDILSIIRLKEQYLKFSS